MILVDTKVISELWRIRPDARVLAWMDLQAIETLHMSAITVAELRFGIAALPAGKRRSVFERRLESEVLPGFADRVLPFDLDASKAYAVLMAQARQDGKPMGKADGYIAAIAVSRGLVVASRDVDPFRTAGVDVINPWGHGKG